MALRKLATYTHPHGDHLHAVIYRDAEWEEYRVKFYEDGLHQTDADYHTDTLGDATAPAKRGR